MAIKRPKNAILSVYRYRNDQNPPGNWLGWKKTCQKFKKRIGTVEFENKPIKDVLAPELNAIFEFGSKKYILEAISSKK